MSSLSTSRQRCNLALDDFMTNDFVLDGATSDDFTLDPLRLADVTLYELFALCHTEVKVHMTMSLVDGPAEAVRRSQTALTGHPEVRQVVASRGRGLLVGRRSRIHGGGRGKHLGERKG